MYHDFMEKNNFSGSFNGSLLGEDIKTKWVKSKVPVVTPLRKIMKNPISRRDKKEGGAKKLTISFEGGTKKIYSTPPTHQDVRRGRPGLARKLSYRNPNSPFMGQNTRLPFTNLVQKKMAKPSDVREIIISALRFGDAKFPQGMLYQNIMDSMTEAYEIPNSPAFVMAISCTLSQLVSQGIVVEVKYN
jgi:hypothetical protein